MDKAAYQYRVWSYFEKSSVYRRLDITIEQATEDRKRAAMDLFERPRIWRKIGFPKGYLIPKSKCFGENGDFQCKKPHEHDRTIIAGPRDTLRLEMRDMARALAAIAQLSESFAVKTPSDLARELQAAFKIIAKNPTNVCQACGEPKPSWSSAKLDAASFFTACNRSRCLEAAEMAIRKAEKIGQAVLLCKEQKGADKIQRKPVFDKSRFRRVDFADVRKALAWLAQDCRFSVGDSIYEQVGGLPQGSSFSPILARLYLDAAHRSFEKNPKTFMAEVLDFKRRIGKNPGLAVNFVPCR